MKTDVNTSLQKFVSIRQIEQAWSVSRTTIYELINQGVLSKRKVKGATRIPLSEVENYMTSQTEGKKK